MRATAPCPQCPKTDCFAMSKNQARICVALTACLETEKKPCPFYKTEEQLLEEQKRCYQRLVEKTGFMGTFEEYQHGAGRRVI